MAENLMNADHKATNQKYRNNYDRIFRKAAGYKSKPPKERGSTFNAREYDGDR